MSRAILPWACMLGIMMCVGCGTTEPQLTGRDRSTSSESAHQLEGIASYYANGFNGRKTSNGETYDMHALTAAHRTLPFNSKVRVVNLENKKNVVVRVNDRGPFKRDRVIDLSFEAAKRLGLIANGTASVKIEILEFGKEQN